MLWQKLLNIIFGLIYPQTCFFCHLPGTNLCSQCRNSRFTYFTKKFCHVCNGLLRDPHVYVHRPCTKRTSLDGLFASFVLNPALKKYLSKIKYSFYTSLLVELAPDIKSTLANRCFVFDLITWVPLHVYRQNWRGFNQAELIAKTISFQAQPLLKRIRPTLQQVHLPKNSRKMNIVKAFVGKPVNIKNKAILLCDDVYTTGSTLEACALELKKMGASKVYGYVLAQDLLSADAAIIEAESKR